MACYSLVNTTTSNGQTQKTFAVLDMADANCDTFVNLAASEYHALLQQSQLQVFDSEAYDLAFYAPLKLWAIGIGIGFILAIIAKVKR